MRSNLILLQMIQYLITVDCKLCNSAITCNWMWLFKQQYTCVLDFVQNKIVTIEDIKVGDKLFVTYDTVLPIARVEI